MCVPFSLSTILYHQTVRQMGNTKSHFRDGVGSGEREPNRATGQQGGQGRAAVGWAGLGWWSTDPIDAVLQTEGGGRALGSVLPLEPCPAAISSMLFRANRRSPIWLDSRISPFATCASPKARERPQSPFSFLPFYFPSPPPLPCLVVESVSSCFPCVCVVCACLWCQGQQLRFKLNPPACPPACLQGRKEPSAIPA